MAMPISSIPKWNLWTVADLERLPEDGKRYEILHGELFVTPRASLLRFDSSSLRAIQLLHKHTI